MSDPEDNLFEEGAEETMFDLSSKKKKKKKKVVAFEEELEEKENDVFEKNDQESNDAVNESEEKAEDDEAAAMFAALKKKKKKKKTSADEEQPEQEAVTEIGEFGDLSTMKKKRKKKPDLAVFEKQLKEGDEEEGNQEGVDLFAPEGEEENEKKETHGEETWLASDRDYTYQELLGRVFKILRQNNPELAGEKKRYTIVPPSVHREGNKKTIFANVGDICKRMHRQPEHVIQFLFAEMGTSGSIDGSQRLVIKGRFQQKQIENVLRRYIVEYVTCKTCKSPDTILTKENRIFFMQCESCGSTRSVSAIKSGFHAQIEKRAAQRRAAQ